MRVEHVNLMDNGFHNDVVLRHLRGNLPDSVSYGKVDESRIQALAEHTNYSKANRSILAEELLNQYSRLTEPLDSASPVYKNINHLREANTITVTTGQQIHIFLGPMFVINKIMSCIAEAKRIQEKHPQYHVIPVFWMASEDHDFDEIRTTQLYNEIYTWDRPKRGAVGRLNPSTLADLSEAVHNRMDDTEINRHFIRLCHHAYANHDTFAQATHYIVHKLFEEHGLVVIDPDSQNLKSLFVDVMINDILHNTLQKPIDSQIGILKSEGIKPPINTRPINHFHLGDGKRNRIIEEGGKYSTLDGSKSWNRAELKTDIENNSKDFSPNALMRPLYQQRILPNIVYVTGASEFIYWLELKQAFKSQGLFEPALQVRKSVFMMGSGAQKMFDRYQIDYDHLLDDSETFTTELASKSQHNMNQIEAAYAAIRKSISDLEQMAAKLQISPPSKGFRKSLKSFDISFDDQFNRWKNEVIHRNEQMNKLIKLKEKVRSPSFVWERNDFIINNLNLVYKLIEPSSLDAITWCDESTAGICLNT